jgi:phosphatidylserine/phosphatidylglycerophosphate/cardiolipin synthase-like enzyme
MRVGLMLALLFFTFQAYAGDLKPAEGNTQVKCSFGSDCDELLIEQIKSAKKEMKVAIYSITHRKIAWAFVNAAKKGVKVTVKYDEGQSDWVGMQAALKILRDAKISCTPIKMSKEYSNMHHKFTVIDGVKVLTGSFNYSAAGSKRNYENLVLISSKDIASAYLKEFKAIKSR